MADQRIQPVRSLEAEGGGQGVLKQGAPWHHGGAVAIRIPRKDRREPVDPLLDQPQAGGALDQPAGVDGILTCRAPMHPARGGFVRLRDFCRQQLDHGNGGVAGKGGLAADVGHVIKVGAAGLGDHRGGLSGDDPLRRLVTRECRFEIEHALQCGGIAENCRHLGIGEQVSVNSGQHHRQNFPQSPFPFGAVRARLECVATKGNPVFHLSALARDENQNARARSCRE